MKNKFSIFFLVLKKIGCSPNFMKRSIKWSLELQDGNHLVAAKWFTCENKIKFSGHQVVHGSPMLK
jgi:hypothetical protein